jgi:hypothetical protein
MRTCDRVAAALRGGERGLAAFVAFTFIAGVFAAAVFL